MNVVVHMTKCSPNSTVASARVARFIANTLGEKDPFTLVDCKVGAHSISKTYAIQTLFIVNGPMAFCDFLPELALMVLQAKHVIFVQQDYTIMPPSADSKAESPFRKVFADLKLRPTFWSTVKANVLQSVGDQYINWNMLTYDPQPLRPFSVEGLFYYGAYREKREGMFKEYLANKEFPVTVSTTTLRGKKFKALDDKIQIVQPFSSIKEMPVARASVYIEDPKSSREFHSPANRFYELLSAGVPIFFDYQSIDMLAEAGIHPKSKWFTISGGHLGELMKSLDPDTMRREQRALWHRDYVGDLRQQLLSAWATHKERM